jgi:hypothetical protein
MVAGALEILETIATSGQAPPEGCSRFDVKNDDAIRRLKATYLDGYFGEGRSAEKFVVGPFGAGKTHFLRVLAETATKMDCVTSEVSLARDIDATQPMMIYREFAQSIRVPGSDGRGIRGLIEESVARTRRRAGADPTVQDELLRSWAGQLSSANFEEPRIARILRKAVLACHRGDEDLLEAAERWLGGEMTNAAVAKVLGEEKLARTDAARVGRKSLHTIAQFAKSAGFMGTVVCFDEAEQGFSLPKKKLDQILSMLRADIDAIARLRRASLFVIYAITPDVVDQMREYMALRQRIDDPAPDQGFYSGNDRAPTIQLDQRSGFHDDLGLIAKSLVDLYVAEMEGNARAQRSKLDAAADTIVRRIGEADATSGTRRRAAKHVAIMLLRFQDDGIVNVPTEIAADETAPADEVD